MANSAAQPKETAKAAQAFADYVAMGPSRSLRKLADSYVRQNRYRTATTALRVFQDWSTKYGWQDRIATAKTEQSTRMLEEAAELDADTFLATSKLLNETVHYSTRHDLDAVVKMRESVRRPKGTVEVTGKNGGPIQHDHIHRDMTGFTDNEIETLAAIAERAKSEAHS